MNSKAGVLFEQFMTPFNTGQVLRNKSLFLKSTFKKALVAFLKG